jgi:hypothetical protein
MKKTSNRNTANQNTITETAAASSDNAAPANVVTMRPAKGERVNLFETINQEVSEAQAQKVNQLSEARQRLAEARDLWLQGAEHETEAREMAAKAARALYAARTAGTLSGEELSALLGDQFGFKMKQDGKTPSKTPDGQGEAIRKRIVRAVQAFEHANGINENHRFFENIPAEAVEPVLNQLASGDVGIWTVYDRLAKIKAENSAGPIRAELDPKRIAALAEALNKEGVAKAIATNMALAAAYADLFKMIQVVGEEAATLRNAA